VYAQKEVRKKSYEQIKTELEKAYKMGSRFVDFQGGEPTLWKENELDLNSLIRLARKIGFFSATVTTNAILPFQGLEADSVWVSLDGLGKYHDAVRGEGAFEKLVQNIEECGHKDLSVNMVVSKLNVESVDETIEFAKNNPHIKSISINFMMPYPGIEQYKVDWETRLAVIDKVIAYKKKGYPIMNSVSGLKKMKDTKFKKYCWVSNFITIDGEFLSDCGGEKLGLCDECGFCMAGEMNSVMTLKPDTIFAGMRLRM
jgi:MoaA/NifB/PqqE/SkfB family radical SAM enzyme